MNKMGTGHTKHKQTSFFKTNWKHQYSHGGILRNKRAGRKARPLSSKEPVHLVFKLNSFRLRRRSLRAPQEFALAMKIIKKYASYFNVKVEQLSIQGDHIHALIRTTRRSQFQYFFRVVPGQIAQRFQKEGLFTNLVTGTQSLWKHRPFTRVIKGWRTYKIVKNYIQLNEQEAQGKIPYQKRRLKGLSSGDWQILWT